MSGFQMVPQALTIVYKRRIFCIKLSRLADHLKTKQICPVFEWLASLDRFIQKKFFFFCIKQSRLRGPIHNQTFLSGFGMVSHFVLAIQKPDSNCV
jgi:hypothetical protein